MSRKNNKGVDGGAPKGFNEVIDAGQPEVYGLFNMHEKKDKFEKFLDKATGDYIFNIENLPEAFAKLEEIEDPEAELRHFKEVLHGSKTPK